MSNWTVKYRTENGELRKEVVSASSRSDVFSLLKGRGLTPVQVVEGGSASVVGNPSRRVNYKWLLIGLSFVLIIAGSYFTYTILASGSQEPSQPSLQKVVHKPASEHKPAKPTASSSAGIILPEGVKVKTQVAPDKKEQAPSKNLTPEDEGYVSPDPTFAERYKKFKEEQARLPFKNSSDLEIYRIISTKPGETILPTALPRDFEKDFLAHLNDPIEINDDDSEELKQDKQNVIEVKHRLKELMDEGKSIRDILTEEQNHLHKVATMRDNLYAELKEIEKTAKSTQEIDDFVAAANKMLEEYGGKNIKLPMSPERFRLLKAEGKLK